MKTKQELNQQIQRANNLLERLKEANKNIKKLIK
jgi:flagellar hook-associated protein FlgK